MSNTAAAIQHKDLSIAFVAFGLYVHRETDAPVSRAKSLGKRPERVVSEASVAPLPPDIVVREGAEPMSRPPHIRALLLDAFAKIRKVFGDSVRIALKRSIDPEGSADDAILYIVIGTDLGGAVADDAFDRFQDEWWADNVDRGRDRVHVALEFL